MKLKNTLCSIILISLTVLLFSSCEERYYWAGGWLDRMTQRPFYTDFKGEIEGSFRVEWRDIYTEASGTIENMRFLGYEEIVLTTKNSTVLHEVWLHVNGTTMEIPLGSLRGSKSLNGNDNIDIIHFMEVVIDEIRREGYADINVYAVNVNGLTHSGYDGIPLDVQLLSDVEVYLRDY